MYPDKSMSVSMSVTPTQSHMHEAVTRVDSLVADIEQNVELLQSRLEPVVFHRPSEVPLETDIHNPQYAPLASEIHGLADRLATIRDSLGHTLASLEV